MKPYLLLASLSSALLLGLSSAPAAIVLSDFSEFETSGVYPPEFRGTWVGQGIQNIDGTYEISGDSTDDFADGVDVYFSEATDFTGQEYLAVTAKLLEGSETTSFSFQLFDSNGLSGLALFDSSLFSLSDYQTVVVAFLFDPGFDLTSVEQWTLTGGIPGGISPFAISFDSVVAVPEPHSVGLIALSAVVLLVCIHRRKRMIS